MPEYTLTVNGSTRRVTAAADAPLIYILRNDLQLPATRLGCGMAQCGSCAVLADGKEIRACVTPISRVGTKKIHTIEGLPGMWAGKKGLSGDKAAATLHPVQQAWIELQVPQCGYCQSGMMIAAVDLLEKNPKPTAEQVRAAFSDTPPSPHLCRCGTYPAIIAAVQHAAKLMGA
jgi:isoquinoline 1-oxidoreductase alpha subunit